MLLELVRPEPDWFAALDVALLRPAGVPERRSGEDPWAPRAVERPRRISDDLAWFRDALDDAGTHGLQPLDDTAAVSAWRPEESAAEPLARLDARGVLDAAGFLLHEDDAVPA